MSCTERNAGFFEHDFLRSMVAAVLQISATKPNSTCCCWKRDVNLFYCWSIGWKKLNIIIRDPICYLISPPSDYKRRSMYCVWGDVETFLIVICRIVHQLLLRECELFVNIINAWLIKEFTVVSFLKRWSKAQQRFTGGWGPGPGGAICCWYFY